MSGIRREEVVVMLGAIERAWKRGDLKGLCSFYAWDASFLSSSRWARGRKFILGRYQTLFPDPMNMGRLSFKLLEFSRWGTSNSQRASAIVTWQLEQVSAKTEGFSLLVLKKTSKLGKVRICQDASV